MSAAVPITVRVSETRLTQQCRSFSFTTGPIIAARL